MGNACSDYTPAPVLWWRRRVERQRQAALDALIASHSTSAKCLEGIISALRRERLGFHDARRTLVEEAAKKGEAPSADVIDEVRYLTLEMIRINREIVKTRKKVGGVRGQLRMLNNVNYNKEIQRNWVQIKENFKRLGLEIETLAKDAEAATEAMEDMNEYNEEHNHHEEGIFSITNFGAEEEERAAVQETARLFNFPVAAHKEESKRAKVPITREDSKPARKVLQPGEGLGLLLPAMNQV